jgi:hypothetical protein
LGPGYISGRTHERSLGLLNFILLTQ